MSRRDVDALLAQLLEGRKLAAARLISLVEDEAPGYRDLLARLLPLTGEGYRVGVTGPPGAGKSSLLDEMVVGTRNRGLSVGVVAVDPSSPFTGGALLGDRIRMRKAAEDPDVFIRSLGSRGSLGGLSRQTEGVVDVLDAFGKERIFIETVGVGQSELDVIEPTYTTIVVLVPESGDGIQTMKAGLMEIGDLFVVNKADREGADLLETELETTLDARPALDGWRPRVLRTCATRGEGVEALLDAVEEHRAFLMREGRLSLRRREILMRRLRAAVEDRLTAAAWAGGRRERALEMSLAKLVSGQLSFETLVDTVLPLTLLEQIEQGQVSDAQGDERR